MEKLPAGKKDQPTTGQNHNRSHLALAPPIPSSLDDEQRNHDDDIGLRTVGAEAAAAEEDRTLFGGDTDKLTTMAEDKTEKKHVVQPGSGSTLGGIPESNTGPGVTIHESKRDEERFVATKQRSSAGNKTRRLGGRKTTSSFSQASAPGAVLIPGIDYRNDVSHSNALENGDVPIADLESHNPDNGDILAGDAEEASIVIVAAQVVQNDSDDENRDGEQTDSKIQQEIESRLNRHNQNLFVVDAIVATRPSMGDDGDEPTSSLENRKILGLSRKVLFCVLLFLSLLAGSIVTGVMISLNKSDSPAPINVRAVIMEKYENTSIFDNPQSPQAQALQWLSQDPYTLSQRKTATVLERYALAVFYLSTNGASWVDGLNFLSSRETCSWNNGLILTGKDKQALRGAHCQSALAVDLVQFHDDGLRGTLPSELSLLTDLVFLNLTSNSLTGTIPTELSRLSNLRWLNFADSSLTGTIPRQLGALTSLVKLSLGACNLEGTLPTELGLLTALTQLDVFDNSFNETLPREIGACTALEIFQAHNNNFVGSLPVELMQWSRLLSFAVDGNRLTGTLPTQFGQLTDLEDVRVSDFVGTISTELGLLTSLQYLDVSNNSFSGTLPTELGRFPTMTMLSLNSNFFTGTLPTELGNLTAMTFFDIDENKLTGSLPTELGQWNSLESFLAYENDLTGTLPTELGGWNSLSHLLVYRNSLVGTVPTEFGQLRVLTALDISANALTGVLPTELSQLSRLVWFSFYHNNFTGSVSNTLCSETREWETLAGDCSMDASGQVEINCSCCTACCTLNESACMEA